MQYNGTTELHFWYFWYAITTTTTKQKNTHTLKTRMRQMLVMGQGVIRLSPFMRCTYFSHLFKAVIDQCGCLCAVRTGYEMAARRL